VDTNIFVGAMNRGYGGVNRCIFELCFLDDLKPMMTDTLYFEYTDLLERDYLYHHSVLSADERQDFFDAFCSICDWVDIHYRWRPNLKDEADNHVLELAIAGGADLVLTWNARDFGQADLVVPDIHIMRPDDFLNAYEINRKEQ